MYTKRLADGSSITTPIHMGVGASDEELEAAKNCSHEFQPQRETLEEMPDGVWIVLEKCTKCGPQVITTRAHTAPTRELLTKDWNPPWQP